MTGYVASERRRSGDKGDQFLIVKSWHTTIIVITLIVGVVLAYGTLRDGNDENTRRIRDIELRPSVTREVYDIGQRSIEKRLDRIDAKLDAQDVRNVGVDRSTARAAAKNSRQ
jgi:hypothetical protein